MTLPPFSHTGSALHGANQDSYLAVGPFPPDTTIQSLEINLNASGTLLGNLAAALVNSNDPSAANLQSGSSLLESGIASSLGIPSLRIQMTTGSIVAITIPINRIVIGGPQWILIGFDNTDSLDAVGAIYSATSIGMVPRGFAAPGDSDIAPPQIIGGAAVPITGGKTAARTRLT